MLFQISELSKDLALAEDFLPGSVVLPTSLKKAGENEEGDTENQEEKPKKQSAKG